LHPSARQVEILRSLDDKGVCTVTDLAARLSVSDETIRRDIKAMANRGLVERVHGGVTLPNLLQEPTFQKRLARNAEEKRAISLVAAQCVRNGESLMLDTGSTTAYVARALVNHTDLMVVTNCTDIAATLSKGKGNKVYMAGGEFRYDDGAVFGQSTVSFVEQFQTRLAVLSIGGINLEQGLMDFHLGEAELSRAIIRNAARVIVVADHTKLGLQAPVKVCDLSAIDTLITDLMPPSSYIEGLAEAGVTLLTAEDD